MGGDLKKPPVPKKSAKKQIMAKIKKSLIGGNMIESTPKKTRQGSGQHTKYAASSRNGAKKRYRGQGR